MATRNDKIQFRGAAEKRAGHTLDQMRLGGINLSELAREGLKEKLRESLSDEEKIQIHQRYTQGDLPEDVAQILIGDTLEEIERETATFADAMDLDTDGMYQE